MHDHNLDDLIIDEEVTQKSDKTKGILTIIALLIVVLIIAIVLTKIILKEPKVDTVIVDQNTQAIDPELTLKEKTSDIIEKKSINENNMTVDTNHIETTDIIENTIEKPIIKPIQNKVDSNNISIKKIEHKKNDKKLVDKVKISDEFEQIHKSKSTHKVKEKVISEKYYIQVGSFSQQPSGKFLNVIKNSGFNYTVLSLPNGMKKLLIGPYLSRQAVDKALPKVRDRITKGAFVYKVK